MDLMDQFLWGTVGSVAVEVVNLVKIFNSGRRFPKKFKVRWYWVVRAMLAIVAGLVAVATQFEFPLLALQVGAATPLIVDAWAKRRPQAIVPSRNG
jgi:hypothetical protein